LFANEDVMAGGGGATMLLTTSVIRVKADDSKDNGMQHRLTWMKDDLS